MKTLIQHSIFITVFLLVAGSINALEPQKKASLYAHLCEVNKEWLKVSPHSLSEEVSFENDIARIQTHLRLVEQHLRAHTPAIAPAFAAHRAESLDDLHRYQNRGEFPVNTFHEHRIPYFIDVHGTPCAVGQLIISSGHRELAEMVSREDNYAYLRQMHFPELNDWVKQSGFTMDELAWIQPAYQPQYSWTTEGAKVEGEIEVFLSTMVGGKEMLYVAGEFDKVEGMEGMNNIAAFDGNNWMKLGDGLNGRVSAMTIYTNTLYVGGEFTLADGEPAAYVARWTGSKWEAVGNGFNAPVRTLAVHDNTLYAGGSFTASGTVSNLYLSRLGFGNWISLPEQVNGPVNALISTSEGDLVVAGEFTMAGTTAAKHIALYSSHTWQAMDGGIEGPVNALAEYDGKIYAGGELKDEHQADIEGFASWDGDNWETEHTRQSISGQRINRFLQHGDHLYIIGDFNFFPGIGNYGQNIIEYNKAGYGEGMASMKGSLNTGIVFRDALYFGGALDSLLSDEWMAPGGLFYQALPSSVAEPAQVQSASGPYPNPAHDIFYIDFPSVSDYDLRLYNLLGNEVRHLSGTGSKVAVQREDLSSGVYIYSICADGVPAKNGRIVIAAPPAH
ncbi:MAG: T9SS type A sorting domain-containing protein [Bacteroidia bacterium]